MHHYWIFPLSLLVVCIGNTAPAQDLVFDPSHTMACIEATNHQDAGRCLGLSAEHCMRDTQGGYSTAGEAECLRTEAAFWDGRMNATYQELMAEDRAQDADFLAPEYPGLTQAGTLREMQLGWIAYRDGTCRYEAAQWTGGTGQGPAYEACIMRLTAVQTLYLERHLSQGNY